MVSRLQVAGVVADRLESGRQRAIREAAAWLVQTGRGREARYLARDVAAVLADRGYVLVQVTSARPLGNSKTELERYIKRITGAKHLELEATVDAGVVGGVKIETPLAALDATVKTKLTRYVEEVSA